MAVTLTVEALAAALRLGDSAEETAGSNPTPGLRFYCRGQSCARCTRQGPRRSGPTLGRVPFRPAGSVPILCLRQRLEELGRGADVVALQNTPGGLRGRRGRYSPTLWGELMPAGRRITINVSTEGTRPPELQGEYVPGTITAIGVWATRRDVSQELKLERSGTRDETSRDWRIRWDARIALIPTNLLQVVDGGETFTITNMVEVTRQRGAPDLRPKVHRPSRDTWLMKIWPFGNKLEHREAYTDALISSLLASAQG